MEKVTKVRVELYDGEELLRTVDGVGIFGLVPFANDEGKIEGASALRMGGLDSFTALQVSRDLRKMSEAMLMDVLGAHAGSEPDDEDEEPAED